MMSGPAALQLRDVQSGSADFGVTCVLCVLCPDMSCVCGICVQHKGKLRQAKAFAKVALGYERGTALSG